jgi:hypothetical protein
MRRARADGGLDAWAGKLSSGVAVGRATRSIFEIPAIEDLKEIGERAHVASRELHSIIGSLA